MKKGWMAAILLAIVLASCISSTSETELTATPIRAVVLSLPLGEQMILPQLDQIAFELVTPEPMHMDFPGGQNLYYIDVIHFDGYLFHAYVYAANPGVSFGRYYAVSTDGVDWVVDQEPVEFPFAVGKAELRLNRLQQMTDGSWRLITTQLEYSSSGNMLNQEIWSLTADSIEGPWALAEEPLLSASEDGIWDQYGVQFSALYWDEERYYILYLSSDFSFQGLAISDDGVAWRRSLPDGSTGPYPDDGNLIFMERSDGIWRPQVVWRTPTGWQMIYSYSRSQDYGFEGLRSAVSPDGVNWEPIEVELLFENPHGNQEPWSFTPFWIEAQLHIAYCIWDGSESDCYLGRLVEHPSE